jgi:LEA14-like dessication related protein
MSRIFQNSRALCLAFCLLLIYAIGCVGKVKKIDVLRIGEVQIYDVTEDSLHCLVSVDVRNPQIVKVRIDDLSFQMGITQGSIGSGQTEKPIEIDSNSVKTLQMPLQVVFKKFSKKDYQALFQSHIPYHIVGNVELEKPIHVKEVEIDSFGRIKAPSRMKVRLLDQSFMNLAKFESFQAGPVNLLPGKAKIRLNIKNPFQFEVGLYSFTYRFESGGKVIADGILVESTVLSPGPNQVVLPINFHPLEGLKEAIGAIFDAKFHRVTAYGTIVLREGSKKLTIDLSYQESQTP